jgi:hypothetical protein
LRVVFLSSSITFFNAPGEFFLSSPKKASAGLFEGISCSHDVPICMHPDGLVKKTHF